MTSSPFLPDSYPRLKCFKNRRFFDCYLTILGVQNSMTWCFKWGRRTLIDTWKHSVEISDPASDTQNTLRVIDLPWPGQCGADWPDMCREQRSGFIMKWSVLLFCHSVITGRDMVRRKGWTEGMRMAMRRQWLVHYSDMGCSGRGRRRLWHWNAHHMTGLGRLDANRCIWIWNPCIWIIYVTWDIFCV